MKDDLVIVESPSKSKTIEKYLGPGYRVVSSKGHIRDLATSGKFGLGVDVDNNFEPNYVTIKGKKSIVSDLKKEVKNSNKIYLATDPDREGEAISWHLMDALGIKDKDYERVLFHEITKDKVLEAIKNPSKIDFDLVKSQEARRILDRIIGFRLSKLMQSKTGGKSAGRVQSVALKLIVDREREIKSFNSEEYWTITANFNEFSAFLFKYKNDDIEIKTEIDADSILNNISDTYKIEKVEEKEKNKKSKAPFITSTLQQEASTKLGFNAKKTMSIAQKLYEGIEIENGPVGLITYMRTDSIRLSDEFILSTYKYISENFGDNYKGYAKVGKKNDNVQDAHEAIRPTSILRNPLKIKRYLSSDEFKLYSMIYNRALASLMSDAKVNATSVILDNNDYKFKATGQILIFDGYLKVYSQYESSEDVILPKLNENESLITTDVEKEQHFTKPPARYTEAKLIKEMEELGIGRPSTYAKTIDTLKERNYVNIEEKKFIPTEIGIETTDKLQEFFSNLINVEYTAEMENDLDLIADGKKESVAILKNFYSIFEPSVEVAFKDMEKKAPIETGEKCPECGSSMVIRKGKYGEFEACSNYPACKHIKKQERVIVEIMDCPLCDGRIIEKKTKRNKIFYGCSNYPTCKFASWDKPVEEKCPDCGNVMVDKNGKVKCNTCNDEK